MPQSYATFNNQVDTDNTFFGALSKGLAETSKLKKSEADVQNTQLHNAALQQLLNDHVQDHDLQTQVLQAQIQEQQAHAKVAAGTVDTKIQEEHANLLHVNALTDSLNLDMETQKQLRPNLIHAKELELQLLGKQVGSYDISEKLRQKALETNTAAQQQGIDFTKEGHNLSLAKGFGELGAQGAATARTRAETDLITKQALGYDAKLSGDIVQKKLLLITALTTNDKLSPGSRAAVLKSISDSDPDFATFKNNPDLFDDKSFQALLREELMNDPRTAAKTMLLDKGISPDIIFPHFINNHMVNDPTGDYEKAFSEDMQKAFVKSRLSTKHAKESLTPEPLPGTVMVTPQMPAGSNGDAPAQPQQQKPTSQVTKPQTKVESPIASELLDVLGRNSDHFAANGEGADSSEAYNNLKLTGSFADRKPGTTELRNHDQVNKYIPTQYSGLAAEKYKRGPKIEIINKIDGLMRQGAEDAGTYRSATTNTALLLALRKAVLKGEDPRAIGAAFSQSPYLQNLDQLQRDRFNELMKSLAPKE